MAVAVGQRLQGSGRSVYILDRKCADTPWHQLYEARKVFFNYRAHERQFYEAAEDEWIDVLLRAGVDPGPGQEVARQQGREVLHYETTRVLTGAVPWFPEPLDWLEVSPGPSKAGQGAGGVPALVLSRCHGQGLRQWQQEYGPGNPRGVRLAGEVLDLLHVLHERGQVIGAFSPDDFLADETGRLFFLATDRVVAARQSARLRPFFPPVRYPAGFAAPEVHEPGSGLDVRSDLYSWALLCLFLVTGHSPGPDPSPLISFSASLRQDFAEQFAGACRRAPSVLSAHSAARPMPPSPEVVQRWSSCLERCLAGSREKRPTSVEQLRRELM